MVDGLQGIGRGLDIPIQTTYQGGMFGYFFNENPVTDYPSAKTSDGELFKKFFHGMLSQGIYLAPSAFEAGFMSHAHSTVDIDRTLAVARQVLTVVRKG